MTSLTRWTRVWVNSRSWWWTGSAGVLPFMGSQRVGHDWATDLIWSAMQETKFDPWVGKFHWRRKWQLTPVFLPGKSHGQRSLAGYSLWVGRIRHNFTTNPIITTTVDGFVDEPNKEWDLRWAISSARINYGWKLLKTEWQLIQLNIHDYWW